MQRCRSVVDSDEVARARIARRARLLPAVLNKAAGVDYLFVDIVYIVVFTGMGDNVSLSRIQAQHQHLNACFNMVNNFSAHVPQSGRYNFYGVRGNSSIVFHPVDYNTVTEDMVTRVQAPSGTTFTGLTDVTQWLSRHGHNVRHKGKVNLIIAPLDGFLGESEVSGNTCVVLHSTVGGPILKGTLTSFDLGTTSVHEIGHMMSLPHTFSGGCGQVFSDIPPQILPNYDFVLMEADGKWDGRLDNRYRDCQIYKEGDNSYLISGSQPPYSCFNCSSTTTNCTECVTELYEQACNFLDYSQDQYIVMFSGQQAQAMREYLLSAESLITVIPGDQNAVIPGEGTLTDNNQPTAADTDLKLMGLPLWAIGVIVGGVVVLIVVIWLIVRAVQQRKGK